jgi:acyl-CoA synthetase (NDP forming)
MNRTQIQKVLSEKVIDADLLSQACPILAEDEAKRFFKQFNIPVVEEITAREEAEVLNACHQIGYPVVLKGICPSKPHKTEAGLVRVGLNNDDQVRSALAQMAQMHQDQLDRWLVQPQLTGKREFVAGMFKDPQFGPVILFGIGGIMTEVFEDVVYKLAPLCKADIDDMFDQLKSAALLSAFRGESQVNRKTLEQILMGLSQIACDHSEIKEIDINPLIVSPDGDPVAVDGLIVLEKQAARIQSAPVDINQLAACYYPESIAFIGASATPGKWGHLLVTSTLSADYKGHIYLVNPKGGQIYKRDVYTAVEQIPGDVDLAVITIPADRVLDLIPRLKAKNVKGMLLITSGFKEVGQAGADLEKKVVAAAKAANILVLGPNTMGMCNPHANFYTTASGANPRPGSTTLVCQSGNMGTQLLTFAEQQGIGIRSYSGSGNEAMVTVEDYMEAFEKDALTKTVVLYIESVKDGPRFFKSARRVSATKPVVVLKGGRTQAGVKAASSHTGAMATDTRIFDAACRQAGIIQVDQPMALLDLSAVFSSLPLPKGRRVAILTLGGGWGVVAADLCTEYGLDVPELSGALIERLNQVLPEYWSHGNPVDIVGEGDPQIPKTCLEELMKWDGCDAVIHLGVHGRRILTEKMIQMAGKIQPDLDKERVRFFAEMAQNVENDYIRHVGKMIQTYQKPVIGVSLLTDESSKTLYRMENCSYKGVFFPSPERAVKSLAGMCQYTCWRTQQTRLNGQETY